MKKYFLMVFILNSILFSAQAPAIDWQKVYGGIGNERLNKIIHTVDGGYILSGESESEVSGDKTLPIFGGFDYWIIKTNASGAIEWQKDFGGSDSENRPTIMETSDGGYLIGGDSQSNISGNKTENTNGFNDFWVLKLNNLGNIEWQNTIGASFTDILSSIIETPDGGYLLGGSSVSNSSNDKSENNVGFPFGLPYYTYYDYWIVKIDTLGNIQWDNTIGSKLTDAVTITLNASDGGYLIGGYTSCDVSGDQNGMCYGDLDCWIVKLDIDGSILWQKTIGGSLFDEPEDAINTSDGGYLLGLVSKSNISGNKTENCKGDQDFWIVKIDSLGNIVWDKTLGGNGGEYLGGLCEDNNHNFYIGGASYSNISGDKTENSRGGSDYWLVKIDNTGTVLWDKTMGGAENEFSSDISYNASDDSIIIGGTSLSSNTGDITEVSRGSADYWVVKLASDSLGTTSFNSSTVSVYPNPTTKNIFIDFSEMFKNIKINVVNVLGQLVFEKNYTNMSKIEFNIEGAKGIYFVNIENENKKKKTFKIVKE